MGRKGRLSLGAEPGLPWRCIAGVHAPPLGAARAGAEVV